MDRSCKGGRDEGCKGQSRLCLDRQVKSEQAAFLGHCLKEVKVSGQGRGREKGTVQRVPQAPFTAAACCTTVLKLQIFSHAKKKNHLQSAQVTELMPSSPSLHIPPMFSKSKVSVMLYRKANRRLCGDRKFSPK